MSLSKIRLELARCKEHPDGAHDIGYEFAAPLKEDRFGDHAFRLGEYLSVREDDELMPYKVVRVTPVA